MSFSRDEDVPKVQRFLSNEARPSYRQGILYCKLFPEAVAVLFETSVFSSELLKACPKAERLPLVPASLPNR